MEAQDLRFPADLRPPGSDLAAFCGNPNAARAELNGMLAASPAVSAAILPLNCCEAAEAGVISMQLPTPLLVMWRHQVGQGPAPPVMLDLANLPAGWSVSVLSGCTSLQGGCKPTDRFDSGLTGTLAVAGNFGGYQMSTCLSVAEAGGTPHPVIHSLRLWIPTTSAH
ncbi:MAG: hypothetical protein EXR72_03835 [Myxococcales bacterium]|nr:hypothetical protein [Myxococcales bacterium]